MNSGAFAWPIKKLADVAIRIQSGGTPKADNPNLYGGDIPFAMIEDMTRSRKFLFSTEKSITQEGLNNSSAWIVPKGTVLYSIYATIGVPAITEIPLATNQAILSIIPNKALIHTEFLYYWLESIRDKVVHFAGHTTQSNLNARIVKDFEIPVPTLAVQTKVAEILSSLDRSLEQTQALIDKYQRVKTGLMQDMLTRGIDEHGHLRHPDTHEFKDSPLGKIPLEWKVFRLQDVASVERGQFKHRPRDDPRFYGGVYPFIQTGDVTRNLGGYITSHRQSLNERGTRVSREFPKGTIAVTIAANIADTAILGIPMYFPDSVVGVVVNGGNSTRYIEMCIRRHKPIFEALAPQSAQKNINLEDLRPMLIPVPELEEQERIAELYEINERALSAESMRRIKLETLKSGLMQDLLSGRVSVEGLVERAGMTVS